MSCSMSLQCAEGEDLVQQEGHSLDTDGRAPAGPPGHQPPGQDQAVGEGDQGHAQQAHHSSGIVVSTFF